MCLQPWGDLGSVCSPVKVSGNSKWLLQLFQPASGHCNILQSCMWSWCSFTQVSCQCVGYSFISRISSISPTVNITETRNYIPQSSAANLPLSNWYWYLAIHLIIIAMPTDSDTISIYGGGWDGINQGLHHSSRTPADICIGKIPGRRHFLA